MQHGRLNKVEIARIARIYKDLEALRAKLNQGQKLNYDELAVETCLVGARNHLGDLLRWQDRQTLIEIGGK